MILAAMLFPVFMAFAYPASYLSAMVSPTPHDMAVEVVETTDSAPQIAQDLSVQGEDALEVSTVADVEQAKADVLALETRAAYDPATGDLYVASAGGMQATNVAQGVFQEVADQTDTQLAVQDLRAPDENDTLGMSFMYILIGSLVGGYVTATMLNSVASRTRLPFKLAVQLLMAVVAAVLTTGVVYGLHGVYSEHLVTVGLVAGATFLTSSVVMLGISGLMGQASTLVGITLFVILGIPTTGVAITPDLLPGFFRMLHRMLPSGASGELMRRVLYFDGVGVAPWILLLVTWLLVGGALLWLGSLRAPGRRDSVVAEGAEHVRKHPDDPLLTAYEPSPEDAIDGPGAPGGPGVPGPAGDPASEGTPGTSDDPTSGAAPARHRAQEAGLA